MHELSITQGIVESVCEAVRDGKVLAVTVEIGKLSGVVSDSVRFASTCALRAPPSRVPGWTSSTWLAAADADAAITRWR